MSLRIKTFIAVLGLSVCAWASFRFWIPSVSTGDAFDVGWQELNRGNWRGVQRQIDTLRQQPGHSDELQVLRGGLLLRTGDPEAAVRELFSVPESSPAFLQASLLICESYYSQQRWLDVVTTANAVLTKFPDNPDAHRWLGAAYYDLGNTQAAEDHLKRLTQLAPADYSPHRLLGLIHKDYGRLKEAIAAYRAAFERQPPERVRPEICRELAQCQIQQNDFAGAMQTLDLSPNEPNIDLQMLRAECLWALDRKDEAMQMLKNAMQTNGDAPATLRLSARFAVDEGRTDNAVSPLEKLTTLDPFDHQALFDLSLAYRRVGRVADADRVLERRNAVFSRMEQMANLNMKAIREPENAAVREELAAVCEQLGKKELATAWRQAATAIRSGSNFTPASPPSNAPSRSAIGPPPPSKPQ